MLAALPKLAPNLPAAGHKARDGRPVGRADALLLAQLAAAATARSAAGRRRRRCARRPAARRRAAWFAPGLTVALLPDWETLPYDHFSPHQDLVSQRLATLHHVSRGECNVLVVAATTALYRLAPQEYLAAFTFFLKQGTRLDVDALRAQLALAGYRMSRRWSRPASSACAAD
jgi:transcription-repair coupling factor (superfamily II helicase)